MVDWVCVRRIQLLTHWPVLEQSFYILHSSLSSGSSWWSSIKLKRNIEVFFMSFIIRDCYFWFIEILHFIMASQIRLCSRIFFAWIPFTLFSKYNRENNVHRIWRHMLSVQKGVTFRWLDLSEIHLYFFALEPRELKVWKYWSSIRPTYISLSYLAAWSVNHLLKQYYFLPWRDHQSHCLSRSVEQTHSNIEGILLWSKNLCSLLSRCLFRVPNPIRSQTGSTHL